MPGLNFVYADVDGNIGWIAAARTPVRPRHDGLLPGARATAATSGRATCRVRGPAAALQPDGRLAGDRQPQHPARRLPAPDRLRVRRRRTASSASATRSTAKEKWDAGGLPRPSSTTTRRCPGLALARLLKGVDLQDDELAAVREAADGVGRPPDGRREGRAALRGLAAELQEAFYAPHVPKELRRGARRARAACRCCWRRWRRPTRAGSARTPTAGPRPAAARDVRPGRASSCKTLPGRQQERWGALHTVTFRHPLATLDPALAKAFNLGPFERPGDANTPEQHPLRRRRSGRSTGRRYRHLFDLADWDRAWRPAPRASRASRAARTTPTCCRCGRGRVLPAGVLAEEGGGGDTASAGAEAAVVGFAKDQSSQFSTRSPGIRSKSRRFADSKRRGGPMPWPRSSDPWCPSAGVD